jgi:3'(2'), 5'-bisphosphate nucleotidase
LTDINGYKDFLVKAIAASLQAGQAILEVYDSEFAVEHKADNSPLTRADRQSHELLMDKLSTTDLPILSEEGREIPYENRKNWERLWIIDPLDGTKEFIKRNDEFTVNIALVEYGMPALGVVYAPVKKALYFAAKNIGSFKNDNPTELDRLVKESDPKKPATVFKKIVDVSIKLPVARIQRLPFIIVGSRSHASPELKKFVEEKRQEYGEVEFISAGSSLKICLVAEGKADMYPRLGPTCEWDTAAGQAVAEIAGAKLLDFKTGEPLRYNRSDILNPWFIVRR